MLAARLWSFASSNTRRGCAGSGSIASSAISRNSPALLAPDGCACSTIAVSSRPFVIALARAFIGSPLLRVRARLAWTAGRWRILDVEISPLALTNRLRRFGFWTPFASPQMSERVPLAREPPRVLNGHTPDAPSVCSQASAITAPLGIEARIAVIATMTIAAQVSGFTEGGCHQAVISRPAGLPGGAAMTATHAATHLGLAT